MDPQVRKTLQIISRQITDLKQETGYERAENDCYGCYKYDKQKVRGEETLVTNYADRVDVRFKCPRCEKEWVLTILKEKNWMERAGAYLRNYKRLAKEREDFFQKL